MIALTPSRKRLLGETGWAFTGQAVSALGTLVGLRLVTEVVPPAVYGTVALVVGIVALAHGLAVGPLMQAALRFYPEYAGSEGGATALRVAVTRGLRKPAAGALVLLFGALTAWALVGRESAWLALACVVLFVIEAARSVEVTFLNAARNQRTMAWLVSSDAWLRPLAAVATVWLLGAAATSVVLGYTLGAALALLGYYIGKRSKDGAGVDLRPAQAAVPVDARRLSAFAAPLVPLPLFGWVSGQSDRYILAAASGLASAGLYAAIYGLASRPFLMLAAGIELALRQVYYGHVSAGDRAGERRILRLWLAAVAGASLLLLLVIALLHRPIATVLLAAEYRTHSGLMIWIAAGCLFAAGTQVVERVCYARHDTRGVLLIGAAGAGLSIAVVVPLVHAFGIYGAAWAVPIYFGLQLAIAIGRAHWVQSQSNSGNAPSR